MSGADADGADPRPTVLMLALLLVYGGFFVSAPLRDFFELVPLPLVDVGAIAALALAWAALVMVLWRVRIVERVRAMLQAGCA